MSALGSAIKIRPMDWLEKSAAQGQSDLNTIRFDPLLKLLHGNPRFEAFAEKIAPAEVMISLVKDGKKQIRAQ